MSEKKGGRKPANAAAQIIAASQDTTAAHLGDLVSWDKDADVSIPREILRNKLAEHGLSGCLPEFTPEGALGRAFGEGRKPKGFHAVKFRSPNRDAGLSWAVYREQDTTGENEHEHRYLARVRFVAERFVAAPPEGASDYPNADARAWCERVATRAQMNLENATSKDVGIVLTKAASVMGAIPFRKAGGVYIIPPRSSAPWREFVTTLESLDPGIDAVTSIVGLTEFSGNRKALASAVKGSLESDLAEMIADLQKAATVGLRSDAAANRLAEAMHMKAKADMYAEILSEKAAALRAACETMITEFGKVVMGEDNDVFDMGEDFALSKTAPKPAEKPETKKSAAPTGDDAFAIE